MPVDLPDDPETRRRLFKIVLRNEVVRHAAANPDYVLFKRQAHEWIRNELAEYSLLEICRLLHQHVAAGGAIDEQPERRPEYVHYLFHFDLRLSIGGRRIYFETVLEFEDAADEDELTIIVVNIHDV